MLGVVFLAVLLATQSGVLVEGSGLPGEGLQGPQRRSDDAHRQNQPTAHTAGFSKSDARLQNEETSVFTDSEWLVTRLDDALDLLYTGHPPDQTEAVTILKLLAAPLLKNPGPRRRALLRTASPFAGGPDAPRRRGVVQSSVLMDMDGEDVKILGEAAFYLGVLTSTGLAPHAAPRNPLEATRLMLAAARTGLPAAQLALASRLEHGFYTGQHCESAYSWLKLAADGFAAETEEAGDFAPQPMPVVLRDRWRDAAFVPEAALLHGEDQVAMEMDLAARGDAEAQRHVAYRQLMGLGLDADADGAAAAFAGAAAAGDPYGLFMTGYMHLRGINGVTNYTAAREYFEEAAAGGLPNAYNDLGYMHYHGMGVEANFTAAIEAWRAGQAAGDADSTYNLGNMVWRGHESLEQNVTEALELLQAAHSAGHWKAPLTLAEMYAESHDVPNGPNCSQALDYLWTFVEERSDWLDLLQESFDLLTGDQSIAVPQSKSQEQRQIVKHPWSALLQTIFLAEQGSVVAAMNAAWMAEHGHGVNGPLAEDLAGYFHRRAATSRDSAAMVDYGNWLLRRPEAAAPAHVARARELYEGAAPGDAEAATALAWMHATGYGVPRNTTASRALLLQAIATVPDEASKFAPRVALLTLRVADVVEKVMPTTAAAALQAVAGHAVELFKRAADAVSELKDLWTSVPHTGAADWEELR